VGDFQAYIDNNGTGIIHENAVVTANVNGDVNNDGKILVDIFDTGFTNLTTTFFGPSQIDGNAIVTLQARNINTTSIASGTPGAYLAMALEAAIYPNAAGTIGGDAIVNVAATQDINAAGSALFLIANGNYQNLGPGMIGGTLELM